MTNIRKFNTVATALIDANILKLQLEIEHTELLNDVRKLIMLRCSQGKKPEVKAELAKHGVERATDLTTVQLGRMRSYLLYNMVEIVPEPLEAIDLMLRAFRLGYTNALLAKFAEYKAKNYDELSSDDKWDFIKYLRTL